MVLKWYGSQPASMLPTDMKAILDLLRTQWFQLAKQLAISKSIALIKILLQKITRWCKISTRNNTISTHIGVNAFAFANIHIIAHAIFHTYKASCWSLLLSIESITCRQLNVFISNHVVQPSTSNQPSIVWCKFDSSLSAGRGSNWYVYVFQFLFRTSQIALKLN